tara:strand:+ start:263 stop:520 length:258 start_codon:yes stop_codon:yes gene_type:complete
MRFFAICHWLGFLSSTSLFILMAFLHPELSVRLIYLNESSNTTGSYFGWLASLIFASTLPAFAGWLMGRIADKRKNFLPFRKSSR